MPPGDLARDDVAELAGIMAVLVKDDDSAVVGISDINQRVAIAVEANGDALGRVELPVPGSVLSNDSQRQAVAVELHNVVFPRVGNVIIAKRIGGDAERHSELRCPAVLGNPIEDDRGESGSVDSQKAGQRQHERG
jgi:hypothetical protein